MISLSLCVPSASTARKTTRKTRSTRSKNGEKEPASAFGLDTAQKNIKKRAGYVFQPLEKRLAQSEVDFDLRELNGIFESSKKRRMEVPGMLLEGSRRGSHSSAMC